LRTVLPKKVALALVKRGQFQIGRGVGHVAGQAVLHGRVDGEHIELVHFADLGGQRSGRRQLTHFPARHMVAFAKARHHKGALCQAFVGACTVVLKRLVNHVLIDFITDQHNLSWR